MTPLDLLLVTTLGFLGSFGHCVGMCGPLVVGLSLSNAPGKSTSRWQQQLSFHVLLNLGRMVSYGLIGVAIGGLGSVFIAGGQLAGVGSLLRRGMTLFTGTLLIWFGLSQIKPRWLPPIPIFHPLRQGELHQRLSGTLGQLSQGSQWWTPALLGLVWGLIPCGFLYAAQIKAAGTGDLWFGGITMLAFGLGTLPMMLGVGVSTALVSADRRAQLFRLGGWVTLVMGVLMILRTDAMVDYTGHAALLCLVLTLIARPLSRLWSGPLRFRRLLGVSAFVLSLAHIGYTFDHTWAWQVPAIAFMLPAHQWGIWAGVGAVLLMTPPALTSTDRMVKRLGSRWRRLHLLSLPAFVLCTAHVTLIGSHYLGGLDWTWLHQLRTVLLGGCLLGVLLVRSRWVWSLLSLEKYYAAPHQPH